MEFLAYCIAHSIPVKATTVQYGLTGDPMPLVSQLYSWSAVTLREFRADCDECGARAAALYSKRILPIGRDLVGGKEAYFSSCKNCFELGNLYLDPSLWVTKPFEYLATMSVIQDVTGLNHKQQAMALSHAVAALQEGINVQPIACEGCNLLLFDGIGDCM